MAKPLVIIFGGKKRVKRAHLGSNSTIWAKRMLRSMSKKGLVNQDGKRIKT